MDLRTDPRTARAFSALDMVLPTGASARHVLSALDDDEPAEFLCGVTSTRTLTNLVLVLTEDRVLLVPVSDAEPVRALRRHGVRGVTYKGRLSSAVGLNEPGLTEPLRLGGITAETARRLAAHLPSLRPVEKDEWAAWPSGTARSRRADSRERSAAMREAIERQVASRGRGNASQQTPPANDETPPVPDSTPAIPAEPPTSTTGSSEPAAPIGEPRARPAPTHRETLRAEFRAAATAARDSMGQQADRRAGSEPSSGSGPGEAWRRTEPTPAGPARSSTPAPPRLTPNGPEYRLHGGRPVMHWSDAEALAVEILVNLGFVDARLTPAGPDGGIDAVARGAVAQAKFEQTKTGAPVVQALVGVAHPRGVKAVCLSFAGYTAQARTYAEDVHAALFSFETDGTVTAVSTEAIRLMVAAQEAQADPATLRKLRTQRKQVESAAEGLDKVLGQAQWLMSAASAAIRHDSSKSARKDQQKAIKKISKVLSDLERLDKKPIGFAQSMALLSARNSLKESARLLHVKIPRKIP